MDIEKKLFKTIWWEKIKAKKYHSMLYCLFISKLKLFSLLKNPKCKNAVNGIYTGDYLTKNVIFVKLFSIRPEIKNSIC